MARQLVYEGPDLQQLLQQVIDEHGPARIHPPERRRKGGVLGFFAREVYVITVDVDAPATGANSAAPIPPPRPGAGADEMPTSAATRSPATAMAGLRGEQPLGHGSTSHAAAAPGSLPDAMVQTPLAALVESTEDEAELGASNGTAATAASGAERAGAAPSAANGHAGGGPDLTGSGGGGRLPLHAAPSEREKPFGEVLSEVASSLGEEPGTYRPDHDRMRRPRRAGTSGDAGEPAEAVDDSDGGTAAQAPDGTAAALTLEHEEATGSIAVQLPLIQIEEEVPPDLGATIVDLLRAAGFPEQLLPRAPLAPEHSTIEAVFAALPEPPPLPAEPGGLVAVVGSAGLVRPVANSVALAVGCPRDEVAVASATASDRHARPEYRARTAAQAAAMSPGWRRDRVGVVAVYAPPLGADQRWTRQILRALRPSCVWGMAGATTKPDDVRRWITAIGGIDALVMTEVGATATPAAVLSLGIPVTRLDDEPATPARWAAVVADLVTKH